MPSQATRPPLVGMPAAWAVFDRDWLAQRGEPARGGPPDPRTEDAKRLWSAADLGAVLAVAASLGYVRETNYGRLFDVRVESPPSNLAFTSLPIPPHTDNPYRDPAPTAQLLHCLHNAAEGGPRSLQPVRLPGPQAASFYAAYAAFAELLPAASSMLTIRLRPGDCAVFDNTRVLHARTGFAQAGRRYLQGCYADLDGVESAAAVGERATTDAVRRKDRT